MQIPTVPPKTDIFARKISELPVASHPGVPPIFGGARSLLGEWPFLLGEVIGASAQSSGTLLTFA